MDRIIGIYKVKNPKGKVYIGQSTNVYYRWYTGHKHWYNQFKAKSNKFKNSLKKYGWENHKFEIIEECSVELLNEREIYWINHYNSFKTGLNSQVGGYTGYHNDEWRKNQSKNTKGVPRPPLLGKKRPEHSEFLRVNGCGFSYKRTQKHKDNLSQMMKDVWDNRREDISKKITQGKIGKGLKPIICDTLFGMEFSSLKEASNILNLNAGNICEVLKGNKIHIKGFVFRYKDFLDSTG
jgi:group I intron endonuclease